VPGAGFDELSDAFDSLLMTYFTFVLSIAIMLGLSVSQLKRVSSETAGDPLQHVYLLFIGYLAVYGLSLYKAQSWMVREVPSDVIPWVNLLPSLGLGCIVLGYNSALRNMPVVIKRYAQRRCYPDRMLVCGFSLCLLGIAGELFFIRESNGIDNYFSSNGDARNFAGTTAYVYSSRWLLTPGISILLGAATCVRSFALKVAIGFLIAGSVVYNLAVGQRTGIVIYGLLAVAAVRILFRRRIALPALLATLLLALSVMGIMRRYRYEFYIGSNFAELRQFFAKPITQIVSGSIMSMFTDDAENFSDEPAVEMKLYARYLEVIPRDVSYDYGVFYLQDAVQWVPHVLWPSRPDFREEKKTELLLRLGPGMCHVCGPTPTLLGMFWLHLGIVSVVVLGVFTGFFYGFFDVHARVGLYKNPLTVAIWLSIMGWPLKATMGLGPAAEFSDWGPFVVLPLVGMVLCCSRASDSRRLRRRVSSPCLEF